MQEISLFTGAKEKILEPGQKAVLLKSLRSTLQTLCSVNRFSSPHLKARFPCWELLFDLTSFKALRHTQSTASEAFIKSGG